MNIVIAVVSSEAHLSGVSRHAANMARSLLTRADVSAVHLIVAEWQYDSMCAATPRNDSRLHIHCVSIGSSALSRNVWYFADLPVFAAQLAADVVHLAYPVPLDRGAFHCPTVVTLHDLYPYDISANFGFPKVLFNRLILQQCLRVVDAIACVSDSTLRQLGIHASQQVVQKAVTIYNCVEPGPPMPEQSPLRDWKGEPFLLCVAQHRRNKNVVLALKIFQRMRRYGELVPTALLVIIGNDGPETLKIHRFIDAADLSENVVLLRGVSDAELQWCYNHCELLLAPSTVEGFGLPIVEAMLQQCRIVCSDISTFREVGGTYCHYVSLKSPAEDAFMLAIRKVRRQVGFREAETSRFSSAPIAEAYLRLYTGLLTQRHLQHNLVALPGKGGNLEHPV